MQGEITLMETILITKDKIKIMLSDEEMSLYNIDCELSKSRVNADAVIWKILDDVSAVSGFDTTTGSFYVQMYPSKSGGCELFVTRLLLDTKHRNGSAPLVFPSSEHEEDRGTAMVGKNDTLSNKNKNRSDEKKWYIYKFCNLENLLGACKELSLSFDGKVSFAYYDKDSESVFLLLECDSHHPSEFGGVKCKRSDLFYLYEHCRLICENAVQRLSPLAL